MSTTTRKSRPARDPMPVGEDGRLAPPPASDEEHNGGDAIASGAETTQQNLKRRAAIRAERRERGGNIDGMRRLRMAPTVELDPANKYRWVEDDERGDVQTLEEHLDYVRVTEEPPRHSGGGRVSVLMAKPKDWYDEDQRREREAAYARGMGQILAGEEPASRESGQSQEGGGLEVTQLRAERKPTSYIP